MKAMRNQPRKMAPMGIATVQAGAMLLLLMVANPTANAVTDTVKKNFGNLVIGQSFGYYVFIFVRTSVCGFEELQDFLVLLGGQVGADAHMHHGHVPLRIAVGIGGPDVMTTRAVLRPQLRGAFSRGDCRGGSRFVCGCAGGFRAGRSTPGEDDSNGRDGEQSDEGHRGSIFCFHILFS